MNFQTIVNNEYVIAILTIILVLYATQAQVKLPSMIENLFKNDIFRAVFLSLLLIFNFKKAPHIALIVAIVFVITMNYIATKETRENFQFMDTLYDQLKLRQYPRRCNVVPYPTNTEIDNPNIQDYYETLPLIPSANQDYDDDAIYQTQLGMQQ